MQQAVLDAVAVALVGVGAVAAVFSALLVWSLLTMASESERAMEADERRRLGA